MTDPSFESKSRLVSRRQFGKSAALVAAAGTLSAPKLISQRKATSPPVRDTPSASLPAADQATVNAKYTNVIRVYGDRLSAPQRVRARETLIQHQRMLMRIRDFALENGDAPATGLRLYPSDVQPVSGSIGKGHE